MQNVPPGPGCWRQGDEPVVPYFPPLDLKKFITAVITTSPIPSHPSTAIFDETYTSVRRHLPDVSILVLADGIRPEQRDEFHDDYEQYRSQLREKE